MPTIKTVGDLILYLGALSGAVAAIGLIVRWVIIAPFQRWLKNLMGLQNDKIDVVQKEVTHNGGGSMKDVLGNINQTLKLVETKVDALTVRLDRHLDNHAMGWGTDDRSSDTGTVGGTETP